MATKRVGTPEKPQDFYDYLLAKNYSEKEVLDWRAIPPGYWSNLPPKQKLQRLSIDHGLFEDVLYSPTRIQRAFHGSTKPNCIMEGPRGTGKSQAIRFDAHMRAMAVPGWSYLIVRRHLTDLHKSHLTFMKGEMKKLGGTYNKNEYTAYYPNGNMGFFAYCEHLGDIENLLSSQYGGVYLDEITTFTWEMITRIGSCARVEDDSDLIAFVKGGTNPLGVGAAEVKRYYITKTVTRDENPEYNPDDYEAIRTTPDDNPYLDWEQYRKRLGTLSEKYKKAWLHGEWINEGSYFLEFSPTREGRPWHVIKKLPTINGKSILHPDNWSYVRFYRSTDWGFRPDPAVCHWYAVLSNGHVIVFMERTWRETVAADVAKGVKRESGDMRIVDTFSDPTMFRKQGETEFSIADRFESNGVPLVPSINDRTMFGRAICDYLNTTLFDGNIEEATPEEIDLRSYPKLQILDEDGRMGCPKLIQTLPDIQSDARDATRIADGGEDHYVVSLAYFCLGDTPPPKHPDRPLRPRWKMSDREFARSFSSRL